MKNPPLAIPDSIGIAQVRLPSLPKRLKNTPWPNMPEKMLVVIDGWNHTSKWLVGAWVADALGALLVSSVDIYCALVTAARMAGVDTGDHVRVASWCEQAAVNIGFERTDTRSYAAQVAVNGAWFQNADSEFENVPKRAVSEVFWDKVRQVLRRCDFDDRVVIVGGDVCRDFPSTPYKFFLDDTDRNTSTSRDRAVLARPSAGKSTNYAHGVTYVDDSDETLMIDTTRCSEPDQVMLVLIECAVRAFESGQIQGSYYEMLREARATGNAVRREMERVLGKSGRCSDVWQFFEPMVPNES